MNSKLVLATILLSNSVVAADIPDFLDKNDINNAQFQCLGDSPQYSAKDQKYIDILWDETLTYLEAYAIALTL